MDVFEMVVFVTALSIGGGVWMEHLKTARRRAEGVGAGHVARLDKLSDDAQQEIAALKERVAVLERLITDEDRRVAREIERLQPRI